MEYPNLAQTINQMKDNKVSGNRVVIGAALKDL